MDRNSVIGILLIIAIMIGYTFWISPSPEELEQQRRTRDSLEQVQAEQVRETKVDTVKAAPEEVEVIAETPDSTINEDSLQQAQLRQQYGPFSVAAEGNDKLITIENEDLEVKISSKGGRLAFARLKNYQTYDSLPLVLFNEELSKLNLSLYLKGNRQINTGDLYFEPMGTDISLTGEDSASLTMRLKTRGEGYIDFIYTLHGSGFMLNFDVYIHNGNDFLADNISDLNLFWQVDMANHEKDIKRERHTSTIYYKYKDDEPDYLSETEDEQLNLEARIKWIAFKQQFFSSAIIADDAFEKFNADVETRHYEDNDKLLETARTNLGIPYDPDQPTFGMAFYLGPNHFSTMRKHDLMLERVIPLGWGIFGWVNRYLVIPVFNLLNSINLNFGIIILILTILIKLLLFPLTWKAYLSTAKMRVLKPEIDEINKKFTKDKPLEKQQAVMALYRKAGVSPMGGCLPMLLQLPILIAMFNFFPSSIELRQESFLWAEDLSTYDSIWTFGYVPIIYDIYGDHVSLFTLLMTISTIIYTRMNSQMTASPEMKSMQWIMYLMPIMFLGIFNNYSSGLSYYYFLTNIITFGQQFLMRRFVNDDALRARIEAHKKKPASQKKSAFQRRLEDAAKKRGYKLP